jgi:hypothetical protein
MLLIMRKLCFVVLAGLLIVCSAADVFAQMNRKMIKRNNKHMAQYRGKKSGFGKNNVYSGIGISINAMNYFGDLSPLPSKFSTDISFTNPGIGLSFFHRFGPRYTLQFQYMYGTLKGSDAESADQNDKENAVFRYQRNLSFRNRIHELSLMAYFDLFENQSTYISRVKWTPYAYVGFAGFYHNPQAQAPDTQADGTTPLAEAGQWVDLQPLGTEGQNATLSSGDVNFGIQKYSLIQVAIPFGVGARFRINEVMDLWADIGFRYTFTDYLDDVSANYVDLGKLTSPLAQALSDRSRDVANATLTTYTSNGQTFQVINGYGSEYPDNNRGNKKENDIFMVTSIKLTYVLGKSFHKAKFR